MRDRKTLAQGKTLIERYQMSGLSVKAFCAEEFISPFTLYYWRKRLNQLDSQESSELVPVRLDRSESDRSRGEDKGLELIYPNGVRISVPMGCDPAVIRELVTLY